MLGIDVEVDFIALTQTRARVRQNLPLEIAPAHSAVNAVAQEYRLPHLAFEAEPAAVLPPGLHVLGSHREDRIRSLAETVGEPAAKSRPLGALDDLGLATPWCRDLDDAGFEQIGDTDEVADIGVDWAGVDLVRSAALLNVTLAHHDDLVAHH